MEVIDSGNRSRAARRVESVAQAAVALADTGAEPLDPQFAALCREAAAEGVVLLRNDSALPVDRDEPLALFGRTQVDYFAVGYGSGGDVNAPYVWNLLDSLRDAGARLDEQLAEVYSAWSAANRPDEGEWGTWPLSFDEMLVPESLMDSVASRVSHALVVIGRSAGEARDSELTPGSFYLTDSERALLDAVTDRFRRVTVVMDIGSVMDFSWLDDYGSKVSALAIAWLGGMEGARAVADVLMGNTAPSGKLTDTIARRYEDYPSAANFGGEWMNVYAEDIYVGYRYFETFSRGDVLFPFGFGLGYSTFELSIAHLETDEHGVTIAVDVNNVGHRYGGKEVVQVYVEVPMRALGQPRRQLAGFVKTPLLAPGASARAHFDITFDGLASYDDNGATGHPYSWVLEGGEYRFFVGTDVRSAVLAGTVTLEPRVVRQVKQVAAVDPRSPFDRMIRHGDSERPAIGWEPAPTVEFDRRARLLDSLPAPLPVSGGPAITYTDVAAGKSSAEAFVAQLTTTELADLTRGDGAMNSSLGARGNAGVLGGVTSDLRARGVPTATTTDGPSGIRLATFATLTPSGTALAATWNTDLVARVAELQCAEMAATGSDVLLAPGMNIRRNPLCGRNFEYFSEDPLVSGRMAAAVVRGIQSGGLAACPKHFAANNQEANRTRNDSRVSERALREIYLRGFEYCIAESQPLSIMTSYNQINGIWAHYHWDLVTSVLRDEWGYSGLVMTDWWMEAAVDPDFENVRDSAYRVRAQVDVLMPGGIKTADGPSDVLDDAILESLGRTDGLTMGELQRCAINVIEFLLRLRPESR